MTSARTLFRRLGSPVYGAESLGPMAVAAIFVLLALLVQLHFSLWAAGGDTPWVHGTFLFNPASRFGDLTWSVDQSRGLDPYFNAHVRAQRPGWFSNYFPFTYQVLACARGWSVRELVRVFLASSAGLYVLASLLAGAFYGEGALAAAALALFSSVVALASYPFLFAIDRGNLETFVAAFCFLSLLCLSKDRPVIGALFLGLAIAVKGYPGFLGLLFLGRGRWRAVLLAAAVALALNAEALLRLHGGAAHNALGLMNGLRGYFGFAGSENSAPASADPYHALLIIGIRWPGLFPSLLPCVAVACQVAMECAVAACAVFAMGARAPFHRRLLAATLGMMLIPDLIADYKLLHLIPVVFFMAVSEKAWSKADLVAFGGLLFLIVPKQYCFLRDYVSMACLVNPLVLLVLLGTLAWDRSAWRPMRWSGPGPNAGHAGEGAS